jgi:hypothetical protein
MQRWARPNARCDDSRQRWKLEPGRVGRPVENFLAAIRSEVPVPQAPPIYALRVAQVTEAACKSAQSGQAERVGEPRLVLHGHAGRTGVHRQCLRPSRLPGRRARSRILRESRLPPRRSEPQNGYKSACESGFDARANRDSPGIARVVGYSGRNASIVECAGWLVTGDAGERRPHTGDTRHLAGAGPDRAAVPRCAK